MTTELLRAADRMVKLLTSDGDPPLVTVPRDIDEPDAINEFVTAYDDLSKAITAAKNGART